MAKPKPRLYVPSTAAMNAAQGVLAKLNAIKPRDEVRYGHLAFRLFGTCWGMFASAWLASTGEDLREPAERIAFLGNPDANGIIFWAWVYDHQGMYFKAWLKRLDEEPALRGA